VKRPLRACAAGAAVAVTLAACGGGGGNGDGDSTADGGNGGGGTEIDMLVPTYSDNTQRLWEEIIAGFTEENPDITVNLEVQSWENIFDVVSTRVQAGEAPDLLNLNAWSAFAADDLLFPASEVLSEDRIADFQDSFREQGTLDGEFYGLPLLASARAMFYNNELLTAAGVTEPPATWDELLAAAQAVTDSGSIGYLMPLGSEEAQAETSIFTFGAGGSWGDAEELTVVTPENVEGVSFMQSMIDAGVTQPEPGASQRTPTFDLFLQGQAAMAMGLPPNVAQAEEAGLDFGVAPIPTQDGSVSTLGVADYLFAFDNGDDKAEAIKAFLDYFFTTENYLTFTDAENFLPTLKSAAEETEHAETFATFIEVLPGASFYPGDNPQWLDVQGALQNLMGQLGQVDAQQVLEQVAAEAGVE
jgi:multiple sugar transport system substrate-binding protein